MGNQRKYSGWCRTRVTTIFDSDDKSHRAGQVIRIVEYELTESATPTQDSYRLVTNILDPKEAPAMELAALYHERWEIEGVFGEFKTHLRANSTVLRSKTPDLVQQEMWALLLAHFAIRQMMAQAAWARGLPSSTPTAVFALISHPGVNEINDLALWVKT